MSEERKYLYKHFIFFLSLPLKTLNALNVLCICIVYSEIYATNSIRSEYCLTHAKKNVLALHLKSVVLRLYLSIIPGL